MKKALAILSALVLTFPLSTAHAVDIVNQDDVMRTVLVTDDAGDREYEIDAKALISDACQKCAIMINDEVLEAEGEDVVSIIDGKLNINK